MKWGAEKETQLFRKKDRWFHVQLSFQWNYVLLENEAQHIAAAVHTIQKGKCNCSPNYTVPSASRLF